MFCYKTLPIPPREWSRVQGSCSLIVVNEIDNQDYVTIPLTGKVVPVSQIGAELAMLNKGNILQYKKNSSNLTKKQKYSQLAQGHRVSRHTTWATQSANGYTNPNTKSLERVNSENIVINPNSDNPITIQDLGTLVCGTIENPITGVVVRQPPIPNCHLTTDSNVPGQIMSLCWNDGITPWYPRTRYTMTNSGNKWPTNATLISAVIVEPPVLTLVSATVSSVSLSWTNNQVVGLPISSYNIYQNFKLIANVLHPNNTITINDLEPGLIYVFYVTAVSNTYPIKTESRPSDIVSNSTAYFVVGGNPIQQVEGNQYTVAFTQTGTITFINPTKPQITFFCGVGGGGGGGGAYVDGGGGGGGGGGGITTTTFNSTSTTYFAIVGSGGAKGNAGRPVENGGNGSSGSNSAFTGTGVSCIGLGGYGGEGAINNSTNGGNGGESGTPGSVGGNGATENTSATSGIIGSGGGGGSYNSSNTSDVSSGANGVLNISVNNNNNFGAGGGGGLGLYNGKPGIAGNTNAGNGGNPGSDGKPNTGGGGGGGQAGNGVRNSSYAGGFGGSGIVVLYFILS